jgi:hypothetical protein
VNFFVVVVVGLPKASVRAAIDSPSSVSKNSGISVSVSAMVLLKKREVVGFGKVTFRV